MSDKPLYDSVAMSREEWALNGLGLLSKGWECLMYERGPVYIRKHISGPRNTESKNWLSVVGSALPDLKPSRHRSKRIRKKLFRMNATPLIGPTIL